MQAAIAMMDEKHVSPTCLFGNGQGFPDSSAGKESACNAGDPGSIPGPGRSSGEGIGFPLQYSWASLVTQLVESACNVGGLDSPEAINFLNCMQEERTVN